MDDPNDLTVARFSYETNERPAILDRAFGGHWSLSLLDFSLPRNAYFPPPAMHAALRHGLPDVITGYGSSQETLDEKLALFLGCDPRSVSLLNGASQAYPILRQLYKHQRVAIPTPTFGEYARAFPCASTYPDLSSNELAHLERSASDADLLVVVNPNNPSGITLPTHSIYALAARTPDTTFLVDESFLPFSDEPSLIGLLEKSPLENVAVLTSLGKAFGVPGLRMGYLYTRSLKLREQFLELMPIWGVNSLAEFFLELTIKFRGDLEDSIALTVVERTRMQHLLEELPQVLRVHDSGANFLLVELRGQDPTVASSLRRDLLATSRIEVKDVSAKYPDLRPRIRVAVRTRDDDDRLLESMQALAAGGVS